MSTRSIESPFAVFHDVKTSKPLEDGRIFVGTVNLDAETNQIAVFFDAALTVPANQPIRTISGFPVNNGSPVTFYTTTDFSITVQDKNSKFLYSSPSQEQLIPTSFVTYKNSITGAVSRSLQSRLEDFIPVTDFAVIGDGVVDDSTQEQVAIDSIGVNGGNLLWPTGTYKTLTKLELGDTASVNRVGIGITGSSRDGTTFTTTGTNPIFDVTSTIGGGTDVEAPHFSDFAISAANGIRINDNTAVVTGPMNVATRWGIDGVLFTGNSTGTGVDLTKAFDGSMTNCQISAYSIGLEIQASDLNIISNVRFTNGPGIDIINRGTGTFSSQNLIVACQFLGGGIGKISNLTCDQHVEYRDCFFEATSTMKGFLSIGKQDIPQLGSNTLSNPLSVSCTGNRFGFQDRVSDFIIRVDPTEIATLDIQTLTTTGIPSSLDNPSFFSTDGTTVKQFLPMFLSNGLTVDFSIQDRTFGRYWDGFRPKTAISPTAGGGWIITAENIGAFRNNVSGAVGVANFRGTEFVIPSIFPINSDLGIRPGGLEQTAANQKNKYFAAGVEYECIVNAMTTNAGGDTLKIQVAGQDGAGAGFGDAFNDFTLTDQFTKFTFEFTGRAENFRQVGFNLRTDTGVGEIIIQSIEWKPLNKRTWTPTLDFDGTSPTSVTYTDRVGTFNKVGSRVDFTCFIDISTWTKGAAAGNLIVTGIPFTAGGTANSFWLDGLQFTGITKAGFTQIVHRIKVGDNSFQFSASDLGGTPSTNVVVADVPTAAPIVLNFSGHFYVD